MKLYLFTCICNCVVAEEEEYDHLDYTRANSIANPNYTRMQTIPRSDRSNGTIRSNASSSTINVPNIPIGNGSARGGATSFSPDSNNLNRNDTAWSKDHNQKLALFKPEDNDD